MGYRLAADAVLLLHLLFVVFVVLGGLLALRWRWIPWVHVPCLVWGATIEFTGWICPLTPLENRLRALGGESGYDGGFIEHYLLPVLYPEDLTRGTQLLLGAILVVVNVGVYAAMWRRYAWR